MLWASIIRWKFQRSSIGKLPAIACCLTADWSAIRSDAAGEDRGEREQGSRSCVHSFAGSTFASQSTMSPSIANR